MVHNVSTPFHTNMSGWSTMCPLPSIQTCQDGPQCVHSLPYKHVRMVHNVSIPFHTNMSGWSTMCPLPSIQTCQDGPQCVHSLSYKHA
jgi:hypothetical protein